MCPTIFRFKSSSQPTKKKSAIKFVLRIFRRKKNKDNGFTQTQISSSTLPSEDNTVSETGTTTPSCIETTDTRSILTDITEVRDVTDEGTGETNNDTKVQKTKMTTLTPDEPEYKEIEKLFHTGLPNQTIMSIIHLQMPTGMVKKHEAYKDASKMTYRMFHGTKTGISCNPYGLITQRNNYSFCKSNCGMCGIIQNGMQKKFSHNSSREYSKSYIILLSSVK